MRKDALLQLLAAAVRGDAPPPAVVAGVSLAIEPVAGRVSVVRGAGANLVLCALDDGLLLSDMSFAALAPALHGALAAFSPHPLRYAIDTHWHPDHADGNATLPEGVTIVSTAATRDRLASGGAALFGHEVPPTPRRGVPSVTFDVALELRVPGEQIELVSFGPGHTDGDAIVFFEDSSVVHMGDCFVTYGFPFIDRASGGRLAGYVDVLERAMARTPEHARIVPGHGPVSSRADVLRLACELRACQELVEDATRRGWPPDEISARGVLADFSHLGRGIVTTEAFIALALSP